jgi:hypothetical protein
MVSIALDNKREEIIAEMFRMESILGYVEKSLQSVKYGCEIIQMAVDRIFEVMTKPLWRENAVKIRSYNMAIRGIIYDIMEEESSNKMLFEDILNYSRVVELMVIMM